MITINGKQYPLWSQFVEQKDRWIGGVLEELDSHDPVDKMFGCDKGGITKITDIRRRTFIQLPLKLLQRDTDCETKQEAFDLFNSFYIKPINQFSEKLYIYTMQKLRTDRWRETKGGEK